jgi:general secretion pathway protein N
MLEHWRPITGVLAACCLWAVTLLVLAFSGLGGRIALLPDDAKDVPPIPSVELTPVAARLGQATDYLEVGQRPLLMPDRKPMAVGPVAGEGATDLDVSLTSVLITPRLQMAILTDNQGGASRRVRVGDQVQGTAWRLVQVEPRRAVLEGPSGQRTLDLRVYNGLGGPAPPEAPQPPPVADTDNPPAPDANAPEGQGPAVMPVATPAPAPTSSDTLTQEQQIEAIRRRIEARRAQMRAEAAKATEDKR